MKSTICGNHSQSVAIFYLKIKSRRQISSDSRFEANQPASRRGTASTKIFTHLIRSITDVDHRLPRSAPNHGVINLLARSI